MLSHVLLDIDSWVDTCIHTSTKYPRVENSGHFKTNLSIKCQSLKQYLMTGVHHRVIFEIIIFWSKSILSKYNI